MRSCRNQFGGLLVRESAECRASDRHSPETLGHGIGAAHVRVAEDLELLPIVIREQRHWNQQLHARSST